ncbi:GTPase [Streptomyces sp. B6B3]|uniref:GTPase n=1 Tax=Streptomyces sp. B6B3 TaxID=3153570 RepID=UPI00325DF4DE
MLDERTTATEGRWMVGPLAPAVPAAFHPSAAPDRPGGLAGAEDGPDTALDRRLTALRELLGLSRTRLAGEPGHGSDELAAAARLLDEAAARERLPRAYTCVAIAGATGSGKSTLFNALAGARLSEAGVRRPTTADALSCAWDAQESAEGPDDLLERLGVPVQSRRQAPLADPGLRGLVLLDLPDHDSLDATHRQQADRLLALVDAVIWLVDPEKYADALLHEHYLRAFADHAEVSLVVLNQADRLPGEALDVVLHDLRRLLDERGVALGEHGDPGARVLAVSALTGRGVGELRAELAQLVAGRGAAARRLVADLDGLVRRLRPLYVAADGVAPAGLTDEAREGFEERLAAAVGAPAAGQAAERAWLRRADRACGTPWSLLLRWLALHQAERRGEPPALAAKRLRAAEPPSVSRTDVERAVRRLVTDTTAGLPEPWAEAVGEAAWRGAAALPRALESALGAQPTGTQPRPRWWSAGAVGQGVLLAAQLLGLGWLLAALVGQPAVGRWLPLALLAGGALAGPLLAWGCRIAARGPARVFGQRETWRLRHLAADRGHRHVLEPLVAELLRYREVRERYVIAASPNGR